MALSSSPSTVTPGENESATTCCRPALPPFSRSRLCSLSARSKTNLCVFGLVVNDTWKGDKHPHGGSDFAF